jgi:hypothetical protein
MQNGLEHELLELDDLCSDAIVTHLLQFERGHVR